MRFEGRVLKDQGGKYWLAEVPLLDVLTQGTPRNDAYYMIVDAIECLLDQKGFKVNACPHDSESFTVGASQENAMIASMLKRQREAHLLTLVEVARRLGQKSPKAYARYKQGRSLPTWENSTNL
jgi:hypothetical protein